MPENNVSQSVRVCKVCGNEYPLTSEYFKPHRKNGNTFDYRCWTCFRKRRANDEKERRARLGEEYNKKDREYRRQRHNNPELRDRENERTREWYHENHEKRRKYANEWRNNNKIKVKAYTHKRRSQKKTSIIEEITPQDIERLYQQCKGKCWWCGKKVKRGNFHLDHRIPLSRGGGHTLGNIVISCVKCNTSKSDKLPHEWSDRLL